jgi:16S rRNA processing protein RimM
VTRPELMSDTAPSAGQAPERLIVARIARPHGLQGEVTVEILTDAPERFVPGLELALGDPDGPGPLRPLVISAVRHHSGKLLLRFEGYDDRDSIETLRGLLSVPFEQARELGPDEYWPHQLTGLSIVDASGERVGAVTEVIPGAAQDLLSVKRDDGPTVLVPAVAALITVELDAGRIVVADLPGLLDP